MRVIVRTDGRTDGFARIVAAFPAKARRAMVEGLNEGGDLERTDARRNLREQMGVKRYGDVVKRTSSTRAGAGLVYTIKGTGKGLPIQAFPVSAAKGGPVTASPWNVVHRFARSFRTSARGLLRARLGATRMPIRALFGPSVAKEIVKDRTAEHFQATAAPKVEAAVMKRLGRIFA